MPRPTPVDLPHPPERIRCAPWTEAAQIDPIGSAPPTDVYVLVDVPLPWPSDLATHPRLAALPQHPGVRVLGVVPDPTATHGLVGVTVWRRGADHRFSGTDHSTEPERLAGFVHDLLHDPRAEGRESAAAPRDLLLCTHGRRDRCCGSLGTSLAAQVTGRWGASVRVRRSSHLGGHRFAPTGLLLPEGTAWAHLDVDVLDLLVRRRGEVSHLHRHLRGLTTLPAPAQVLERALFQELGWRWLGCSIDHVQLTAAPDDEGTRVELRWSGPGAGRAEGLVGVAGAQPLVRCGTTGDLPAGTTHTFALTDVRIEMETTR